MILVTGANGMVGGYLTAAYPPAELLLCDHQSYDIRDYEMGRSHFERIRPRQVIHLAAETDVDRCEREPEHAYRTNVVGTQNIARLANEFDAELVYVSTTGIFDGKTREPYTEFDAPRPLNVYAKTKHEAERIALQLCPRTYVLRAGWMCGGGPETDKKFVGKMLALCQEREEVRVVNDVFGSVSFARDFVANARVVAESGYYGTYHVTNSGGCSRFDIACEMVKALGLPTRVVGVSAAHFPLPARRPRYEVVRNFHLELLGLDRMRPWQEAVRDYLSAWPRPPRAG